MTAIVAEKSPVVSSTSMIIVTGAPTIAGRDRTHADERIDERIGGGTGRELYQ